jgi:hypothetical protein
MIHKLKKKIKKLQEKVERLKAFKAWSIRYGREVVRDKERLKKRLAKYEKV